jgi:hypothetical protein
VAAGKTNSKLATYRRRLAMAAVASVALHLLLAKGLAITHLGLDAAPDAAPAKPLKPKRQADFPLAVPRSPTTEPLAHERPLDVKIRPPEQPQRRPDPRRPDRNVAERKADEPAERVAAAEPQASRAARDRDTALEAAAAAARRAEVAAAQSPTTAADLAAIGAAAAAAQPQAPAPAAATPLPRAEPAPIASRWRPREVALLERLTAPQPAATVTRPTGDGEGEPAARSSAAASRAAATAAAASPTDTTADSITAPAATAAGSAAPVAPAARPRPRSNGPAGATTARAGGGDDASPTAAASARTSVAVAGGRDSRAVTTDDSANPASGPAPGRRQTQAAAGDGAAAAIDLPAATAGGSQAAGGGARPAASGRPAAGAAATAIAGGARSGGATAGAGDDATSPAAATSSTTGIGGGRPAGSGRAAGDSPAPGVAAAPARAAGLASTGNTDAPPLVAIVPPTIGGAGAGVAAATGTARPAAPVPAAVGGFAAGAGQPAASAVASLRGDGADDGDEGLSVSLADSNAPLGGGITRRDGGDGLAAPAPVSPARIAASALPAEGRVRDVAEAFARRSPGKRGTDREKSPDEVRAAAVVDRGLDFLARSQQPDGRWALGRFAGSAPADAPKLQSDTAATGLALLCFLGAGHDHFDGPHRDTVRRGLEFLLAAQKPDGDLYLPADELSNSCAWLYSHGIASIALCEAVGMTGDPRVKPAAEKACGFIAASQHPTRGGWRYTPRSDADLSVSGWMLVAVRSGDLAGLKTDPRTLAGVRTLLEAAASPADSARYAYNPLKPEQRMSPLSNACMTAVGGLMRLHTGAAADDPRVVRAARALAAVPPEYGTASRKVRDSYLWYYASQVLVHTGGPEWQAWYGRLVATLSATQETAGPLAGSWDPLGAIPDRWGLYGGRIYVTALHLLALEVPDRRLPTYSATRR